MTVTNVGALSGSLANGFTYNASVAIAFAQVASATPQTPSATVSASYPAAQTAGDLNVVVVGWNDTSGDRAVGEGQCGEQLQSGDRADESERGCSSRSTMRRTLPAAATR